MSNNQEADMYSRRLEKAQEELKDKDDLIIILKMKLNGSKEKVKELDEEIQKLKAIIERAGEIKNSWENCEFQEATHYTWLDDESERLEKEIAQLKEELKREREAVDFYANGNGIDEDDVEEMEADENMPFAGEQSGKLARQTQQQRKVEL